MSIPFGTEAVVSGGGVPPRSAHAHRFSRPAGKASGASVPRLSLRQGVRLLAPQLQFQAGAHICRRQGRRFSRGAVRRAPTSARAIARDCPGEEPQGESDNGALYEGTPSSNVNPRRGRARALPPPSAITRMVAAGPRALVTAVPAQRPGSPHYAREQPVTTLPPHRRTTEAGQRNSRPCMTPARAPT